MAAAITTLAKLGWSAIAGSSPATQQIDFADFDLGISQEVRDMNGTRGKYNKDFGRVRKNLIHVEPTFRSEPTAVELAVRQHSDDAVSRVLSWGRQPVQPDRRCGRYLRVERVGVPIPTGEPGLASYSLRSIVAYERSGGLPVVGETWGPAAGFWGLKEGKPGWKIISDPGDPSTGLLAAVNAVRQLAPFPLLCEVTVSATSHTVERKTYSAGIVDYSPATTFTNCYSTTGSTIPVGRTVIMFPIPDVPGSYWITPAGTNTVTFDVVTEVACVDDEIEYTLSTVSLTGIGLSVSVS